MSKPTLKTTRRVHGEQVLQAFVQVVRRNLPLDLKNTYITAEEAWYLLGYATTQRTSLEAACQELATAPSGNRLREVVMAGLPDRAGVQRAFNKIFRQQLHPSLWKSQRDFNTAIDLTLIPYHGQPDQNEQELVRGAPKSGTTHFHGYATISIVRDKHRYVVALRFIEAGEPLAEIVRGLLKRLKALKLGIRRVFLDKGFCSQPVLTVLRQHKVSYIIPIPVRGKAGGIRRLFVGHSRATAYTFQSPKHGPYTVQAMVVKRYAKGRYGRHQSQWFAYAVAGLPPNLLPAQVFELYRQRFGIESSYRQANQIRARTSSRNPAFRLLLMGLALVLFNLYISLRQHLAISTKTPSVPFRKTWLTLRRLACLLAQAVETLFQLADVVFRQPRFSFS